jgi:hypothetical protein
LILALPNRVATETGIGPGIVGLPPQSPHGGNPHWPQQYTRIWVGLQISHKSILGAKARTFLDPSGTAEQAAEKLGSDTSGAKAFTGSIALTAALEVCTPPKTRVFQQL